MNAGAGRDWLADAEATSRALTAQHGLPTTDPESIYGDHCVTCDARWSLPADQASCAHRPICEDCWPNGCPECEAQVERDLRHREEATNRIVAAAVELRDGADALTASDLGHLDWRVRGDLLQHVSEALEAVARVTDTLLAQERRPAP